MEPNVITKAQARKIILHAAGLARQAHFGKGKEAAYKFIDHLGFLQIDTNYVVERAHHHAVYSRVPGYKPVWLEQLQADGRIFEFWTYATGYIPIRNFRFSLPVKAAFASRRKPLTQTEINMMNKVLDRIGREGPLMARDFENDRVTKSSGWWDWRPSKIALERLHLDGRLVTFRKANFQKLYDLPENVISRDIDTTMPADDEFANHVIRRALKGLGIASLKEITFSTRFVKISLKDAIQNMIGTGDICNVVVTGLKSAPLYMLSEYKRKTIKLSGSCFILSPFDILNVYRHRLRDFFDFDYQVECFVPKAKRKYGYFSLPVLIGDTFVARMDSKCDRKQGVLIIHNLHFEAVKTTKSMILKLCESMKNFAKFNGCKRIVFEKSNDMIILKAIRKELSKTFPYEEH